MRALLVVLVSLGVVPGGQESPARVTCARVSAPPTLDGKDDDDGWKGAKALSVTVKRPLPPNPGASTEATIRCVRTDTHIYFVVRWKDETKDDADHKPWVWNADKSAYAEGPEREDMFSIAFEHTGAFDADMLSGQPGVWDAWQWKAFRTHPQGYAMDRSHRYTAEKPEGKANAHDAKNGKKVWIARPEDAGDTVEKKQAAPKEKTTDRVPQYLPGMPSGSAADVRAKGAWSDGWWTLELERKLDTGHKDDTAFDLKREYKFAIGTHDRTGDMDKASGVITLAFD
jgi:hypothetical protein